MKEYEGTCYIGVVGGDTIPVLCVTSIVQLDKREGDTPPQFISATKGFTARQMIINKFMETDHDFLLLLDHDMIFEADTLEKLRSHKLPYVSGYYMRRQLAPIYSVWFQPFSGFWPFNPLLDEPPRNKLMELGASGWGCILIHRDVIHKTRKKILKGELDIIEDDMDVWPYDLKAVMAGKEELRPLRVDKTDIIGSDIRYPFYAKAAGFTLYGDPEVRPKHMINYPLSPDDFSGTNIGALAELKESANEKIGSRRKEIQQMLIEVTP